MSDQRPFPCCKHCPSDHEGHGNPCPDGCNDATEVSA